MGDSATRRRILARKAALASLAGLTGVGGAGACAHEPPTVTVEPVAAGATSAPVPTATRVASASPTGTVAHPPHRPPYDDDDTSLVLHPMHGSDPVGPPIIRPTPPPWSTLLGKVRVSSKANLSGGHRIVEVTIVLDDPLEMSPPPYPAIHVAGGRIVKPTFMRGGHGSRSIIVTLELIGSDPVQITLGVVDHAGQRSGHALLDVPAARSGAVGQTLPGKVLRLDN